MDITFTLPLWGIIVLIVTTGTPVIWGLISMYFKQQNMNNEIKSVKNEQVHQEKTIVSLKKDIEDKLDKHKTATDNKLHEINNIAVETKTLVQLLVQDKIKK